MANKTYSGGCHCGAVRYEADLDLAGGTNRCNCSLCSKARAWFVFAKGEGSLRLLSGADALSDYQWTPAGRPKPSLHYRFCRSCGIRVFAQGNLEALGGTFYAVSVPSLDVAPDELAAAPIHYIDGRHNRFDQAPADTRLM